MVPTAAGCLHRHTPPVDYLRSVEEQIDLLVRTVDVESSHFTIVTIGVVIIALYSVSIVLIICRRCLITTNTCNYVTWN